MRIRQNIIARMGLIAEDRGTERLIKHGQKFPAVLNEKAERKIKKVLTSFNGSAIVAVNKEQMQRTEYGH